MKNVHEVLLQKQIELARVKRDLDALRIVAPLLSDAEDRISEAAGSPPVYWRHWRDAAKRFFADTLCWLRAQRLAWRP